MGGYIKHEIEAIPADKYKTFTGDTELLGGVNLIHLPGHTAGLYGMMVTTKAGNTVIFPSDAVNTKANYGPPARLPGMTQDSLSARKSIEKVRTLATEKNATVFYSHDPEIFPTLKFIPEYYE